MVAMTDGRTIIHQNRLYPVSQFDDKIDYAIGYYNLYRYRFSPGKSDAKLSIEVVRITRNEKHFYIDCWALLDDKNLCRFEGVPMLTSGFLLAVMHNPSIGGRFRVINLKRVGLGRRVSQIYAGILLSSTPDYDTQKPAACRIALEKVRDPDRAMVLRDFIQHVDPNTFEHPHKQEIFKIISNENISPASVLLSGDLEASELEVEIKSILV